ncbi:hypothetical protein P3T23_009500 [Paraburkholderia sp. GAS448]|uniref:hypothetical protein n=1 Tax=Paraburkholderia sp. GAS448 TaxID=3035136 RepID=UPI003D1EC37C
MKNIFARIGRIDGFTKLYIGTFTLVVVIAVALSTFTHRETVEVVSGPGELYGRRGPLQITWRRQRNDP